MVTMQQWSTTMPFGLVWLLWHASLSIIRSCRLFGSSGKDMYLSNTHMRLHALYVIFVCIIESIQCCCRVWVDHVVDDLAPVLVDFCRGEKGSVVSVTRYGHQTHGSNVRRSSAESHSEHLRPCSSRAMASYCGGDSDGSLLTDLELLPVWTKYYVKPSVVCFYGRVE